MPDKAEVPMRKAFFYCPILLAFGVILTHCELNKEYRPRSVGDIIREVRPKVQPDRRLSVFRVDFTGDHNDWTLTGEVSSQEALDTLLAELKKNQPQAEFKSQVVVLPPKELEGEKYGIVRISVASQYRDAKFQSELINQAIWGWSFASFAKERAGTMCKCPMDTLDGCLEKVRSEALSHSSRRGAGGRRSLYGTYSAWFTRNLQLPRQL
jgi:hypothetical protein